MASSLTGGPLPRTVVAALGAVILILSSSSAALAANAGWSYVGSGPLATSTRLSTPVQYPAAMQAGDLLLMSCQGKRNSMRWTADGFEWILDYNDWPGGPPGLRQATLFRWADGNEGATLTVRTTTGINGWSCVISAFRRAAGPGPFWQGAQGVLTGPTTVMSDHVSGCLSEPECLVVSWFVSSDDNSHGRASRGSLAFGGAAYDTTVGTDHAVSMVFYEAAIEDDAATMRQVLNGPDSYVSFSLRLLAAE